MLPRNHATDSDNESGIESNDCYQFVLYEDSNGPIIWDEDASVDATYVLYLEGNTERYEQIIEQLKHIRPTKTIWILHNKGYRNCKKSDFIQRPPEDIVDANFTVFNHAKEQGYQNILVLEDDFLFDERLTPDMYDDTREITRFLDSCSSENPFVYYLGTLPLIQCPIERYHNVVFITCGSHAVIYNRACRDCILKIPQKDIRDWDLYVNGMFDLIGSRYTYHVPLCYQIFTNTINSTYWGYQNPIIYWLGEQFHIFNDFLHLDKKIEPGYSFYNLVSKILFLFIFLFVFYLIYSFFSWYLSIFMAGAKTRSSRR